MNYSTNVNTNPVFLILVLWLLYINCSRGAYINESLNKNSTRVQRKTSCGIDQFTCKDGSCIQEELQCNGVADCIDNSDETNECKLIPCIAFYGYQCDYGACIRKSARCNGITECKDSSDERGCSTLNPIYSTQSSCGVTQFVCNSGECINNEKLCDGNADCPDNSDETPDCAIFSCNDAYRCKYGACADKNARCNGIKECFDGSDEQGCFPSVTSLDPTPPVTKPSGSCLVPETPNNGIFLYNTDKGVLKQGDYVPNFSGLVTNCNKNYKLASPNLSFPICINGKWSSSPLHCARFCKYKPPLKLNGITCRLNGIVLESCEDPLDGTSLTVKCEYPYDNLLASKRSNLCSDGTWNYPMDKCVLGCSKNTKDTNLFGKDPVKLEDYPWHVGVYSNRTYICGGSIISTNIVISAAHCFTDFEGRLYPNKKYVIAAGKYYSPYDDIRDTYAQYSEITKVFIPTRYKGPISNYEADLSVVLLSQAFSPSPQVLPICVDWNNELTLQSLTEKDMGVIVGWRSTRENPDVPSIELKELLVPYVPYEQCFEQLPRNFRRFLTHDKNCAGFLNKGISVCIGDGGSGIAFRRKVDGRFFLKGVVSVSPVINNTCDRDQYFTYTSIEKHIDFIRDIELTHRI